MAPPQQKPPDVRKNRQGGICYFLNLQEDNIRFILLAVLLYIYLAIGAFVFQAIEEAGEIKMRKDFEILYNEFIRNLTQCYDVPNVKDEKRTFGFDLDVTQNNDKVDRNGGSDDLDKINRDGGGSNVGGNSYNNRSSGYVMGYGDFKAVSTATTLLLQSSTLSQSSVSGRIINGSGSVSESGERERLDNFGVVDSASTHPFHVTLDGLHDLLFAYGNATQAGVLWKRRRWDWVGSFHFAWTIVSTIGYGATTPTTKLGKILIIPYGFIGCACGLLFFNLFLERIITFLATCMRTYRIQRQKRRPCVDNDLIAERGETLPGPQVVNRRGHSPSHSSTGEESTVEQPDWKPSVYWVMLCLFVMSVAVICVSGALFQHMEEWSFLESVYFSFVSYATIGFGDYVSLQGPNYGRFEILYRFVAFVIMVFGCCCIYSLLNVTSIVIKQFLNYIIKKMDYCGECCCCTYCRCSAAKVRRRISTRRSRRGRVPRKLRHIKSCESRTGGRCRCQIAVIKQSNTARALALGHQYPGSPDANSDCDGVERFAGSRFDLDERRCSGENMISIRGELSNKVSLAVMQKRLYETAQMSRHSYDYPGSFSASSVGPLAIVTEKLGDNPG